MIRAKLISNKSLNCNNGKSTGWRHFIMSECFPFLLSESLVVERPQNKPLTCIVRFSDYNF